MGEIRIRGKRPGFTTLYNSVLQDRRLSLKTIGLFAIMQSFPDDWEYSIGGLSVRAGIGRDAVRKCLRELESAGYLLREQGRGDNGKFACSTYVLQEQAPPLTEKPSTVNPTTEKPSTEKPTSVFQPEVNKHPSNHPSSNPPISPQRGTPSVMFERFWTAYPKKRNKVAARKAWDKLQPDQATLMAMSVGLARQKRSEDWTREGGRFIPYPATWLNGRRWEDEPGPESTPPQPPAERRYGWT